MKPFKLCFYLFFYFNCVKQHQNHLTLLRMATIWFEPMTLLCCWLTESCHMTFEKYIVTYKKFITCSFALTAVLRDSLNLSLTEETKLLQRCNHIQRCASQLLSPVVFLYCNHESIAVTHTYKCICLKCLKIGLTSTKMKRVRGELCLLTHSTTVKISNSKTTNPLM